MRRSLRAIPLLLLGTLPGLANAYPIFFTCDASGHARDVLNAKVIQAKVLSALTAPNSDSEIAAICEGEAECFAVLKQAFLLTQETAGIANALYEKEIAKIQTTLNQIDSDLSVDPSVSATAKNLILMADGVNECRKRQVGMKWSDFSYVGHTESDGTEGRDLLIQPDVDNEYSWISGIYRTESKNRKIDYKTVATVINGAVSAGADPYAALAISFMENGHPVPVILDPRPAMDAMGCKTTRIGTIEDGDDADHLAAIGAKTKALQRQLDTSSENPGEVVLYNYGVFYAYRPQVVTGPSADRYAAQVTQAKQADAATIVSDQPGFACLQNEGAFFADADGKLVQSFNDDFKPSVFSKSKACCMAVPYLATNVFSQMANRKVADVLNGGSSDPAKLLQGFNGRGVIGLTEKTGVGAFRFGLDMAANPQYGAQAMDFILTNLLSNPAIRHLVDDAQRNYRTTPKSVICSGKSAGTYAVDSEKYLNLQKRMKRFTTVIGKDWGALAPREKSMISAEYDFVDQLAGVDHPKLSADENARFQSAITRLDGISDPSAKWNYYRSSVYPFRDTLGKTSQRTWEHLTDDQVLDVREKALAAPLQE
jgi:hypothetical protein